MFNAIKSTFHNHVMTYYSTSKVYRLYGKYSILDFFYCFMKSLLYIFFKN